LSILSFVSPKKKKKGIGVGKESRSIVIEGWGGPKPSICQLGLFWREGKRKTQEYNYKDQGD